MDKVPIKTGSSVEDFLSFQPDPAIHGKPWSLLAECQRSRALASPNPRPLGKTINIRK